MKQPALGQKITELRNAKGITQKELAEQCKVDIRSIQRIEAGEVVPRMYTLNLLSEVLDCDFKNITTEAQCSNDDLPVKTLKFTALAGLVYSVNGIAVVGELICHSFGSAAKLFVFTVHSLSAMGFYYGFYLLGKQSKNQTLAISAMLSMILLPLTNLFYLVDAATVGPVYIALCINCVVFGVGVFNQRSNGNFRLLYSIAGITGIVQSLLFLSFNFSVQSTGLIISIPCDVLLTYILYLEYQNRKQQTTFTNGAVLA
ncbi:helix-turn-helix domain-containing protein [Mucilaginibacter sp. AW1-3]